ncbi:transporter substrate-binding domain-containing protein [Motilimonas sp. 1_MG-2023]|uniref:substrate-binding periplasmic protein n=1 Tax=Motilimonas sp. 1_MG-2023 TaxID=3062672 RepID=UPI0026E31681|nr:transporter substrate-binding domain-containing protein [Motilimonas sp. 1_MG-2023]MDO6527705.1 transporter substrate-binding domain-containing protein [Motilimonas sp. 1_MG-2023]
MKFRWLIFFSFIFSDVALAKSLLVVTYAPSDNAPYVFLGPSGAESGIIVELMDELARRADVVVSYQQVARKRLEYSLQTGKVHVVVTSSPKWLAEPDKVDWALPIFDEKNVLVIRRDSPNITNVEDLIGLTLGTVLGYAYPEIDNELTNGLVIRSDSLEVMHNLTRLKAGRLDAVVTSDIQGTWLLKESGYQNELVFASFLFSEQKITPAVSKLSPVPLDQLNQVLQSMLDDGFITKLLQKYSS